MSEAAQSATTSQTEAAPADASSTQSGVTPPSGQTTLLIAAAGGLITAALLVGAISLVQPTQPGTFGLQTVAQRDINDAATSLDAAVSRGAAEDARQCKTPLAFVTLSLAQGSAS